MYQPVLCTRSTAGCGSGDNSKEKEINCVVTWGHSINYVTVQKYTCFLEHTPTWAVKCYVILESNNWD